ncbi:hypothetical protein ACH42_16540 [Endozoicomonas sp. (ex Bugula neritina AB1)]|nr:hypothetical protein ACH42_16540 [Endozoicomonas sp. (ex Bugula neritina AB1)]
MSVVAILPRILGTLFYYSPESEEAQEMISQLPSIPDLFPWSEMQLVTNLCQSFAEVDINAGLAYTYATLFERQGDLPAPPWGSVYLDKENMLFSDSTEAYCRFLEKYELELNTAAKDPEDQFGLMILTLGVLMESENDEATIELLAIHLLPWAYRYLELVGEADKSHFYAPLATLAEQFLREVQEAYEVTPQPLELFL